MSDGNTATGLLSDLQKLDEAGRDRVLNFLPPENVKDILKASLREREGASNSTASQDQPHGNVHHKTTQTANVAHAVEATKEQDSNPAKRVTYDPIPRQCKQPKIDPNPQGEMIARRGIVEIDPDKANDKNKDLGRDDLPKVLPKERSVHECSIDNKDATGPSKLQDMQRNTLPTFVILGQSDGPALYWNISKIPYHVQTELVRRFDNMWSANEHTIAQYTEYIQNPGKYNFKGQCIHAMMVQGTSVDDRARQEAKEPSRNACSKCIAAGYPCARLAERKNKQGFVIGFMPLPEGLRQGKLWGELGNWVLPEADAAEVTKAR